MKEGCGGGGEEGEERRPFGDLQDVFLPLALAMRPALISHASTATRITTHGEGGREGGRDWAHKTSTVRSKVKTQEARNASERARAGERAE